MKTSIPFNIPLSTGAENTYVTEACQSGKLSGEGVFNQKCAQWFEENIGCKKAFPTPSCTAALEMGLLLAGIGPEDEVILPSFTFTSTATAVVMHHGTPVFVDCHPGTLNINETLIEQAITEKTKAIMPIHYAAVSANMETIMAIAKKHNLIVLEDAAQCVGARYKGKAVGSMAHMSAFSFHDTKNVQCGEGGMLCINDSRFLENAEIARDKGTNRQQFFRGEVDKYSWQGPGSSYLMSELQGAFLYAQLEQEATITQKRRTLWDYYHTALEPLEAEGKLKRPDIPSSCQPNGHIYAIILPSAEDREHTQAALKAAGIQAVPHYMPLHSSTGGQKYGRSASRMPISGDLPHRLLRLPMYYELTEAQQNEVINVLKSC